ncbi:MAG: hypothetical protein RMJ36_05730 [Candidatus Calescibacterium sp.]|nr:hypothetical protein [Candidatus Calescibacterium sp.]MDW8133136.1 hypothetical protein [Candidatus Calescibacterium sp.]
MEGINNAIKRIIKDYPLLFRAILLIKKNKLFKKTKIKKIEGDSLIISTNDYLTFNILNSNKNKVRDYVNDIITKMDPNIKINNVKIVNNPEIVVQKKYNKNLELLSKIRQVKEKLYGHK